MAGSDSKALHVRPLGPDTWPDFARLVEKHNGVWGGCWCISFHIDPSRPRPKGVTADQRRAEKHRRVLEGRAHASLVYDGKDAIGWCQFGSTAELPGIKNRRNYEAAQSFRPNWRITCFFVDKDRRGEGVAAVALKGALREIARNGGGSVEAYPEVVQGRSVPGSFLCNGTLSMFAREGFRRGRQIGMHMWVMSKNVRRAPDRPSVRRTRPG